MIRLLLSLMLLLSSCSTDSSKKEVALRLATASDPTTLDPRQVRDLPTTTLLHMLYEGLMRADPDGKIVPALAEKVTISEDKRTYTFTLRSSNWSNGEALTAADFVRSWISLLDPKKPSPNAYQLFVIKGAKAFSQKEINAQEVRLKAPNPQTLIVELTEPTPYFLELLSTYFYYPVHAVDGVVNGAFKLDSWEHNSLLTFSRNPHYWDAFKVGLDRVEIYVLDENTALRMYENQELDWIGSPMSFIPQDAIASLRAQEKLRFAPAAGTQWLKFNVDEAPLSNLDLRRALALAINRKELADHILQGGQEPATGIVPPVLGLGSKPFFEDHDVTEAWELFQKSLIEMHLDKDSLPQIALCYRSGDRAHKIAQAIQQQWQTVFDIEIKLESCENKHFYARQSAQDYQINMGNWFADVADPINFLEIFKHKSNATNSTGWENERYMALLDASSKEFDPLKRKELLAEAERLLIQEMPVAPLFYSEFNYVKRHNLMGISFSPLGYLDLKYASFGAFETAE